MGFLKKYAKDIALISVIIAIVGIISYNFSFLFVNGESMSPTYHNKDVLILKKAHEVEKNQLVVFKSPKSWKKDESKFIKRILATPGDRVTVSNENLFVNDRFVTNISEKNCGLDKDESFKVDKDQYLVVGDNHANSNDSITQFCSGNSEFLVHKDNLQLTGKEIKVFGGNKNEQN